jgi:drug/metabolite transporter (DMT)-like permease
LPPAGIAYGLLAALSFGGGDFLGASAARRAGVLVAVAGVQLAGLAIMLVVVAIARPPLPGLDGVVLGLLAGVAGGVGLAGLFGGMAVGSMGLVAALSGAGSLVLPLVVGALTGDRVTPLQLVGIGAAAGAAVAASGASRGDVGRRALLLSAVAAIGFGAWYVLLDLGVEAADPLWTLVLSRVAAGTAIALFAVRRFEARRYPFAAVGAAGMFDVGGNALYLAARGEMAIGLAAALTGLYPIVTMLLARLFLRERLSALGLVGVGLAVLAVVLISVGG